ncbi:MAG: hypothetical protein AAF742_04045 [Pseudomonadota bacterium]
MKWVALDSNVLLLYIIGAATGRPLGKRLRAYSQEDIQIIFEFVDMFDAIVTTPNVLTEVSNLQTQGVFGSLELDIRRCFAGIAATTQEVYVPSADVVGHSEFGRLGLTDAAWLHILDGDTVLLTDDIALHDTALSLGFSVQNFTRLRNFE